MRRTNASTSAALRRRLVAFYEYHDPPQAVNARKVDHTLGMVEFDEQKLNNLLEAMYDATLECKSTVTSTPRAHRPDVGTASPPPSRPSLSLLSNFSFPRRSISGRSDVSTDFEEVLDHALHKKEVREHAEDEVHADGRVYFDAETMHIDKQDPFAPLFEVVVQVQERAIPLLAGVVCAMLMANIAPDNYAFIFGPAHHGADGVLSSTLHAASDSNIRDLATRSNSSSNSDSGSGSGSSSGSSHGDDVWSLSSCQVWGHDITCISSRTISSWSSTSQ